MGKLDKGRCGLCCSLLVRLSDDDIRMIMNQGHKDFVEKTPKVQVLRKINGYCTFVEIKKGVATCTIYDIRPKICEEFVCIPEGWDDCKLKRHYDIKDFKKI